MPAARRVAAALWFIAIASCQRRTDELPEGDPELTRDDLLREQRQIAGGMQVGARLQRPTVAVDGKGATINGKQAAGPQDFDATRLGRVEKIRAHLKGLRDHWKMIHPGDSFDGRLELTVDPRVSTFVAASAITSAVFAGYPQGRVTSGATTIEVNFLVPGPPRLVEEPTREVRLRVRRGERGAELVVLTAGPCPSLVARVQTSVTGVEEIEAVAARHCAGGRPCALLVDASGEGFGAVLEQIAPLFSARRNVVLAFSSPLEPDDPTGHGWYSRGLGAGGAPEEPADSPLIRPDAGARLDVKISDLQARGGAPAEAIRKAIQARMSEVRGCYEAALSRNPTLEGRARLLFAVDMNGKLPEVCPGSSTVAEPALTRCVERELGKIEVAAPVEGGASGSVTLGFSRR